MLDSLQLGLAPKGETHTSDCSVNDRKWPLRTIYIFAEWRFRLMSNGGWSKFRARFLGQARMTGVAPTASVRHRRPLVFESQSVNG